MPWRLSSLVALATVLGGATVVSASSRSDPEVTAVIERLENGNDGERSRAIERLRRIGLERISGPLVELVEHGGTRQRIVATEALVSLRDPGAARALERALEDGDWVVRRNAAQALGGLSGKCPKRLANCAERDPNPRARRACVEAAGRRGGAAGSLAVAANTSTDLDTRLKALDGLAASMDLKAAANVRALLTDPIELVQFAAARSLAWSGDPAGRKFLSTHAAGADPERALRAVQLLRDVPRSWAADVLAERLVSKSPEVRRAAAIALEGRGDARGMRALKAWSEVDGGPDAAFALSELARLERRDSP